MCQCPASSLLVANETESSEIHRKRLRNRLVKSLETGSPIDKLQLALLEQPDSELELATQRLANSRMYARRQQHQQEQTIKPSSYLAFGYQLETDTVLEWLASNTASPTPVQAWPRQVCRRCLTGNGSEPESQSGTDWPTSNQEDSVECSLVEPGAPDRLTTGQQASRSIWSRPLVGALESLCVLVTLVLLAGLFRVSRSRVSLVLSGAI